VVPNAGASWVEVMGNEKREREQSRSRPGRNAKRRATLDPDQRCD